MTEQNDWVKEAKDPNTSPERLRLLVSEHGSLRALIARNPNTPQDVLQEIYLKGEAFHFGLVRNPNTPPDLLRSLAVKYPEEFLENPALSLFLIESPDFFQRLPESFFEFFLRRPEPPEIIIECVASSHIWHLRWMAAKHHDLTPAQLSVFARDQASEVTRVVADRLETPAEALLHLLSSSEDEKTIALVAKHPNLPQETLRFLYHVGFREDLSAYQPPERGLTPEEQSRLLQSGPFFRKLLAREPNTPEALLEALAQDESPQVRAEVAQRKALPPSLLEKLLQDQNGFVRGALVQNAELSEELCLRLAQEEDLSSHLAKRASLPDSVFDVFTKELESFYYEVRVKEIEPSAERYQYLAGLATLLVRREDAPPQLLAAISLFPVEEDLLAGDEDPSLELEYRVAHHPSTPAHVLERFSKSCYSEDIRRGAANHPNTPQQALEDLATDPYYIIRWEVAKNPSASRLIVELLCDDPHGLVSSTAKERLEALRASSPDQEKKTQ